VSLCVGENETTVVLFVTSPTRTQNTIFKCQLLSMMGELYR